ncbi:TPA: conjugal transfer protein [Clostridioides difficile]|uniref:Uncharacterized protein n=1 Tax=Clostridioides difficile NAP08 TaxID=525259 RepID=D5Q4M7_CLODI|nr:hypothetical protein C4E42_03645 [Clostridioides difficile]EFH07160.1 hypothetical protein HMPREF0220_1839 [Clostridioides difficile NAP08]EFH15548.1 hypothetical protein HMPREF0219_1671 [Clostridioides difficile NAP07]CCK87043.1 conserved hypothetical protein [Clostridioides difficile T5]CCK90592.1 conserved hypothetical protein [Clostridioides difficile T20]CCK94146.1 conserved hypothetical protein [Clostridioides difficile E1]
MSLDTLISPRNAKIRYKHLSIVSNKTKYLIEHGTRKKVFLFYDKETKVTQLSQFELTLQKNDNWKIIME